jgi:cardiolipin synthase A/B
MDFLREWWPLTAFVLERGTMLIVMGRVLLVSPRGSNALAWFFVLLSLPGVGIAAWFLIGESRLSQHRRRLHAQLAEHIRLGQEARGGHALQVADLPLYRDAVALACAVGGTPPRRGNRVELMGDTETVLERLIGDIDGAHENCHLLFYIWLDDGAGRRVAAALERAHGRGVACRVLVDDVGSRDFLRSRTCAKLREAGVRVVRALPVRLLRVFLARMDLRNHRKLAVIDGRIGYTGSQNVAEASFAPKRRFAPWVDCMLRIEGPVVRDLQGIFVHDWYLETEQTLFELLRGRLPEFAKGVAIQVLPTGPAYDNEALEQLSIGSFHRARTELILTTPYFVPGEAEITSLCTTARRGVRVVLVLPARCDSRLVQAVSRSHYPQLLAAGVELYEYQPGLLHAKTLTVDGRLGLVTTANFDQRSFELNYEVSTLIYDEPFTGELRTLQLDYVRDSLVVSVERERSILGRLVENAAGVFSPLL